MMKKNELAKKQVVKTLTNNLVYPLIAFGIVMAVWAIVSAVSDNPIAYPMPDVVLRKFFTLCTTPNFWQSVGWSLLRTIGCFVLSFALAILFGALGGLFEPLHKVLSPIVTFLRAAPTVAVIFIMYAFVPNKNVMSILVGFLIAFPIMYSAFYSAIVGVDNDLLEMAKVYKVKSLDKVTHVYLPLVAPTLFDTSKSTLSLTLKVVISAEILTSISTSIGGKIQVAYATFADVDVLLAWTLIAILFSFVLEGVVAILKKLWGMKK